MSSQPTDELSDNIVGDLTDSMATGIFSYIITQIVLGKNPSFKSIVNMDTLKNGATAGAGIALYRRIGRPILNNALERGGLGNSIAL